MVGDPLVIMLGCTLVIMVGDPLVIMVDYPLVIMVDDPLVIVVGGPLVIMVVTYTLTIRLLSRRARQLELSAKRHGMRRSFTRRRCQGGFVFIGVS